MGGWECMCEWMSLPYHCCAQTLDRGERCVRRDLQYWRKRHHQARRDRISSSQPGELLKPGRKLRVIVDVVRNGIVGMQSESICWTHLQRFSVSTVVGKKASDVEQSCGASAKLPGRRPPPQWTGRGPVNESIMFGELSILLFFFFSSFFSFFFLFLFFRSLHGCMGMDVWVNVFTMPFLCADSGPWRKMSRAWPPMSAITTSSASTCPSDQESGWGAAEARQEIKVYCRRC